MLVTSSFRPSKIGAIKKTVAAFPLAAWCADFGTQGGAKMGIELVEMGEHWCKNLAGPKVRLNFRAFYQRPPKTRTKTKQTATKISMKITDCFRSIKKNVQINLMRRS